MALSQLEKLSSEYVEQAAADRETAFALHELGDLILQFGAGSAEEASSGGPLLDSRLPVSAVESARRLFARGAEIWEAMAKAGPNDIQAKLYLSISYDRIGDVHLRLGATHKALQFTKKDWTFVRRWRAPTPPTSQ